MRISSSFWKSSSLVCCLVACSGFVEPPAPARVTIFVGPLQRDGFVDVDRGILDSIDDVKGEVRKRKPLRLVATRAEAQLVLEIASRGATSTGGGGSTAIPIGTQTVFIPTGTIGLATVLRVGTYEKPIVFQNCQQWRHCAALVAKDLDAWLGANRAMLDIPR